MSPRLFFWSLAASFICLLFKISSLVAPFQSPDEPSHIYRAYLLSTGQLLLAPHPNAPISDVLNKGSQVGGLINQGLISFKDLYWPLVVDPHRSLTDSEMASARSQEWQKQDDFVQIPGAAYYFPAIYAPQAAALALGCWADLGVSNSYYLARIFSACISLLMLYIAFRLLRPPALTVAILCLPMAIFQVLSPTIDGLSNALTVLVLSIFLNMCDDSCRVNLRMTMGLALGIFVLITTRTHALPLLALLFYLSWKNKSKRDLLIAIVVAICVASWIGFAIFTGYDDRVTRSASSTQLLWNYLTDPVGLFKILWASVTSPDHVLFYLRSYLGLLGWLNVALPKDSYILLSIGLILIASLNFLNINNSPKCDLTSRWLLVGLSACSFFLVFFAMLISWTPTGAMLIEGVQGRYFFIPTILLSYSLSTTMQDSNTRYTVPAEIVTCCFISISFWSTLVALSARYN